MPFESWFFAAIGLLVAVLAVPLIQRRVPPNALYGLRVPATFRDETVWYDANAASGRDLLVLGIVIVVVSLVSPALGARDMVLAVIWCTLTVGGAMLIAVIGWRRADRMLHERMHER